MTLTVTPSGDDVPISPRDRHDHATFLACLIRAARNISDAVSIFPEVEMPLRELLDVADKRARELVAGLEKDI